MPRSVNAWGGGSDRINPHRWTNNLSYEEGHKDGLVLARLGTPEEIASAKRQHANQDKPYCKGFIDALEGAK